MTPLPNTPPPTRVSSTTFDPPATDRSTADSIVAS
jgi:hypothetical protein